MEKFLQQHGSGIQSPIEQASETRASVYEVKSHSLNQEKAKEQRVEQL